MSGIRSSDCRHVYSFLPELCVPRPSFDKGFGKFALIPKVNGVMRSMTCTDQELWVKDVLVPSDYVVHSHRVHVMYQDFIEDLVILDTQITTIVSGDYVMANLPPLGRPIEPLVNVSVETKRRGPDRPRQSKVSKALDERTRLDHVGIGSNHNVKSFGELLPF